MDRAHLQPWQWRSLPLQQRRGQDIFAALFQQDAIAVLLESPHPQPQIPHSRYSLCAGRPRRVEGQLQIWTPRLGRVLPCLRQLLQQCDAPGPNELPFTGGWLGWLGYDLAWEIERLPWLRSDSLPFPVAYWYEPESFAVLDHHQQILWLAAASDPQLDHLTQRLQQSVAIPSLELVRPDSAEPLQPQFLSTQSDYEAAVRRAKQYIQAGDIFQANLSLRFGLQTTLDSWRLYQVLQQINPSPFACYWQTPWGSVVSCSPERLVQLQDRQIQTRPIAGTRPRGITPDQDQKLAEELWSNGKENAEHTMLVDLERNDLGRVATAGSVEVSEFLTIEYYSHVMHLVSNVVGQLHPQLDAVDLIRAAFPGGTITGCPKVRCMEIIEELEPIRRSLFYGSCGYLDQRGYLDLNILIRTLLLPASDPGAGPATIWGQVGAGIVADSDPRQEWQESLAKAKAQLAALTFLQQEQR
jgi:para-aminobenzoate synthetase component I